MPLRVRCVRADGLGRRGSSEQESGTQTSWTFVVREKYTVANLRCQRRQRRSWLCIRVHFISLRKPLASQSEVDFSA